MSGPRPSLAALAEARGLLFGMSVTTSIEQLPRLKQVALAEAGMLVPGVELKWAAIEPQPGRFDFAPADRLLDLARAQTLKARGHALVWHEALPAEVAQTRAPAAMAALMKRHIHTVCGRYAGLLHSWDVVNEPIEPGPTVRRACAGPRSSKRWARSTSTGPSAWPPRWMPPQS